MRITNIGSVAVSCLLGPPLSTRADAQTAAGRTPSDLTHLSGAVEALAARVRPAVVQVLTTRLAAEAAGVASAFFSTQRGSGSGVILDPDGYIVTNAHVVLGARRVQVVLEAPAGAPGPGSILRSRGRVVGAQVIGIDRETDVAVLKVAERGLPTLELGDSEELHQGEVVLAFGSPLGLDGSATLGVVSAVARQLQSDARMIYIQTDAAINPGNSGGPLVNTEGRVVGLNTLIFSQSGGSEGVGFAAPSNIVRNVYEQLRKTGRVRRGDIGVRAQTLTPRLARGLGLRQEWGVILGDVAPEGPAFKAGLRGGDLILMLDGKAMENARQLDVNLYRRPVGGSVSLEVQRGTQRLSFVVVVSERRDDPDRFSDLVNPERNVVAQLGVLALDLDEHVAGLLAPLRARAGVVVAAVAADSPAWQDPLLPGDVVYSVNREPVSGLDRLRELLSRLEPGDAVAIHLERNGELRFISLELE